MQYIVLHSSTVMSMLLLHVVYCVTQWHSYVTANATCSILCYTVAQLCQCYCYMQYIVLHSSTVTLLLMLHVVYCVTQQHSYVNVTATSSILCYTVAQLCYCYCYMQYIVLHSSTVVLLLLLHVVNCVTQQHSYVTSTVTCSTLCYTVAQLCHCYCYMS